ncbi:MAG: thiamine pyrophosphate-binding protein [Candidatus Sabulitectum sp.]|nr:thiamine pyrophosphate-binding protein [Candidatus Sabulitectum sp.]
MTKKDSFLLESSSLRGTERAIDVFLRYLEAEEAMVIFGIPGGLLHPFFEAVDADPRFRLIVTKHEEGAAFMADGFARTSRRLAVCAGTAGPGATNLLTGISCAFADGVPLLVLTGQAASHAIGKGAAQETGREDMDIVAMFRPVTKYSAMVTSPEALPAHLRRALRSALSGRPGPVHLNVPVDFWEKPVKEEWFDPKTYRPSSQTFDRSAVQKATRALLGARHPVLLIGSGVSISGAESKVRTLAELIPARVATTPRAKGIFPENHPLSLGVFGFAGHKLARETILGSGVDILMTIGASLNETTTLNWHSDLEPSICLIQLDIDSDRVGRNYPVDIPLIGDAGAILTEIVYHTHRYIREGEVHRSNWSPEIPVPPWPQRCLEPALISSNAVPLTPQRWRSDLQLSLPGNAVIFSDIGGHMLFNIHYLCIRDEQKFELNLGFGSMGHGTAAPIGAALADPQRPVIAIIGDGCFTMNGMELITAAEYDVPVVWIVEHNNMHGITWHGSKMVGIKRPMKAIKYKKQLDIAGIAKAMGLATFVVERPGEMTKVLPEALAIPGPSLIEVRVDCEIPPPLGDRAKTVAGFVKN